ncbi:amidase [Amphritea opalescens]|uniref:Amidase n=1 Tax=Amphritea opalescens TaxID=2490544 RepID=A0A430KM08_9GAMM|nr:amidase [Amphritea opalescens]RTE64496.1 amidase [Amphritea opalescens]
MKTTDSLSSLGLRRALQGIEEGLYTALDIINACFDQLERREPVVKAWQCRLNREEYLAQYTKYQSFYEQSILKGLPVGIKDIIDTANMPTEMGSAIHKGRQPVDDAACVSQIRQAGGIVLGKTVTTEFAYFKPGDTCNPKDLLRTPGGSSSGSAAAVADSMVPVALGSQTAASVIRPAAYCGAVGYVASRGDFSLRGIQPLAQSLDSLGLLARSVEDIELMRGILLKQPSPLDLPAAQKPTKVVVCDGAAIGDVDGAMQAAIQSTVLELRRHGVDIIEMSAQSSGLLKELVDHHQCIMAYEVCRNLVQEAAQPELLSEPLIDLIDRGVAISYDDYLAARQQAEKIREQLWAEYADCDLMLAPAAPGVAPLGIDKTGAPHMSRPWQAMNLPVITLPGHVFEGNLPLGVQLVGRLNEDQSLLRLARWVEGVLPR